MSLSAHKHILIAPLDWGLGHTTRCLPIINHLQKKGHKVTVAGNLSQRRFISQSLPGTPTLHLEGYNVHYSNSAIGFLPTIFTQVPKLLRAIRNEHEWLQQQADAQGFDAIISDNRYGLYHPTIPSVIITHQLQIQTGLGSLANRLTQIQHYNYLNRFHQCWVADVEGAHNLSGKLAHPTHFPANTSYLGLLSQMQPQSPETGQHHLLMLLSGPEPQRSILSKILWQQAKQHNGPVVFVEGTVQATPPAAIPAHITWHARLTRQQLQPLIQSASMVICRSGYSSLMDLVALGKKAILIPTPGQTEQEYLARHLHRQELFYTMPQKTFNLQKALNESQQFPFKPLTAAFNQFQEVVDRFIG